MQMQKTSNLLADSGGGTDPAARVGGNTPSLLCMFIATTDHFWPENFGILWIFRKRRVKP